jgi:hypothetical protein
MPIIGFSQIHTFKLLFRPNTLAAFYPSKIIPKLPREELKSRSKDTVVLSNKSDIIHTWK